MSGLSDVPSIPVVYEELSVDAIAVGFSQLPGVGQIVRSEALVASGPIRWRKDGKAPTASVGVPAFDGDVLQLDRYEVFRFLAVRQGSTNGVIRAHHFVRA